MFGGFGMTELLVILVIVVMLFGTKKLRNMGGDLGAAIKGFKKAMSSEDESKAISEDRPESLTASENEAVHSAQKQKQEQEQ